MCKDMERRIGKGVDLVKMMADRLNTEYGYPVDSIQYEVPISSGKARFTVDIIAYQNNKPHVLVEVKNVGALENYRGQIEKMVLEIKPSYAIITNGINSVYYKVIEDGFNIKLIKVMDIPQYGKKEINIVVDKDNYYTLSRERYLGLFWSHADLLRESLRGIQQVKYLLIIYLAKYLDELNEKYEFNNLAHESSANIRSKILEILYAKSEVSHLYLREIPNEDEVLKKIVYDLQRVSLLNSAKYFTEIIPTLIKNLVSGREIGEYYLPNPVVDFIIEILAPKSDEYFFNPTSRVGEFILKADQAGSRSVGLNYYQDSFEIGLICLILSGYSGDYIRHNLLTEEIRYSTNLGNIGKNSFDVVVSVPPFNQQITDRYSIHPSLRMNKKNLNSDSLYLELSLDYLKENGRAALLTTSTFLFSSQYTEVRNYLLKNASLDAIVYLNNRAFQPYTGIYACILFYRKKSLGTSKDDPVFFGEIVENEYDEMINQLHQYLNGESIPESEHILINKIDSPENLSWEYLQGQRHISKISSKDTLLLRQIAEITSGTTIQRIGEVNSEGGYKYINVTHLEDGSVNSTKAETISVKSSYEKYTINEGDILISRAGRVAKIALVDIDEPLILGNNLIRIRSKSYKINAKYLFGFLLSKLGQEQINMYKSGSAIPYISASKLGNIIVPVEEATIYSISKKMDDYFDLLIQEKEFLKKINQAKSVTFLEINRLLEEKDT